MEYDCISQKYFIYYEALIESTNQASTSTQVQTKPQWAQIISRKSFFWSREWSSLIITHIENIWISYPEHSLPGI